ncbi:MAG TPA: tetratricopeptide repeat protein [Burkholderiaceae bacterium]|nr:tetratricopeptide repeat protein [Burkholderiaceae bacterium]
MLVFRRAATGAFVLVALTALGCTTVPTESTTPAATPSSQPPSTTPATPPPPPSADPKVAPDSGLPDINLSGTLLYQLMAAEAAVQRGDYAAAYASYLSIARQTRDPRLAQRATEVAISARSFDQALEAAKLWGELAPGSQAPTEMSAALLVASGRLAEAAPLLHQHVESAGQPAEVLAALTRTQRLLARASDRATAMNLLEALAQPYRDHAQIGADVRLLVAAGAHAAGDSERALRETKAALELRPDFERAALVAAQFLNRGEGKDAAAGRAEALALLEQFTTRYPKAFEAGITYARLLVADGKYPEARGQFERLMTLEPRNADVLYALGVLALDTPPPRKEAREYFERFLDVLDESPQGGRTPDPAYLNLARIAEDEKKYDEALQWLARVDDGELQLNARVRKALVLGKLKRVDEGRKLLADTPAANDSGRVQLLLAEGQLLRDARRHRESFEVLTGALAKFPQDTGLLYDAAMAAERLDRIDVMETHLRQLMQLKPQDAHAYNALGYTLADRNVRLREAQQLVEQALKLSPDDAYILDSMGWVQYRLGNLQSAREYLERAFKLKPEAEVGAHLGEVLWRLGEHTEARRVLRVARDADGENEILRATLARLKVRF